MCTMYKFLICNENEKYRKLLNAIYRYVQERTALNENDGHHHHHRIENSYSLVELRMEQKRKAVTMCCTEEFLCLFKVLLHCIACLVNSILMPELHA